MVIFDTSMSLDGYMTAANVRRDSGRVRNMTGRTDSAATDEIGAAIRWNRTTTNSARKELRP
jgi:hypothetical protein